MLQIQTGRNEIELVMLKDAIDAAWFKNLVNADASNINRCVVGASKFVGSLYNSRRNELEVIIRVIKPCLSSKNDLSSSFVFWTAVRSDKTPKRQ